MPMDASLVTSTGSGGFRGLPIEKYLDSANMLHIPEQNRLIFIPLILTLPSITQLTYIIGELSDILGKVTTDENGQYLDGHTHFFSHKGHTHTVTHKHPHNADHHHHDHGNWFERHISSIQATVNQVACARNFLLFLFSTPHWERI